MSLNIQIGADVKGALAGIKQVNKEVGDLARGSLLEAQATVKRLKAEIASLDATALKSKGGRFLAGELRVATAEMKALEKQAGFAGAATSNFASKSFNQLRQLAYILPGVGIAGLFGILTQGLSSVVDELFKVGRASSNLKILSNAMEEAKGKFVEASVLVSDLRSKIQLAKDGFLSKDAVVKEYNETLGKTTGLVKNLDEAEKAITKNGDAYIQMMLQKAVATAAFAKAGELAFQQQLNGLRIQQIRDAPVGSAAFNNAESLIGIFKARNQELQKQLDQFIKIGNSSNTEAAKIAAKLGFNLFGDNKATKVTIPKVEPRAGDVPTKALRHDVEQAIEKAFTNVTGGEGRGERAGQVELNIGVDGSGLEENLKKELDRINSVLSGGIQDLFGAIGEDLGEILSGKGIGKQVASVMGNLITQIGKAMIAYGIVKTGLDKILKEGFLLPGAAAIAIGIGAVALGQLVKSASIKARAAGGPVRKGEPYLVGERGPEVIVPDNSGVVVPNHSLGRGGMAMQAIQVYVSGEIDGRKLRLIQTRQQGFENRNV